MTFEEFWDRWNPCHYAEYGYGGDPTPEELKDIWFKDLERVCENYMAARRELGFLLAEANGQRLVQYYDVPDELLGLGHLWTQMSEMQDSVKTIKYFTCSLCHIGSDEVEAQKECPRMKEQL